jgi:hypothetical protein
MKNKFACLRATQIMGQRFLAWGLLVAAGLFPSMVWAQACGGWGYQVISYESCAGPGKTNCKVTHTTRPYPLPACPPSNPIPPSSPPPPPIKTAAEIEREQHVKFCKEFPAEIDLAVQRCQNQALGYQSYFISSQCPKGGGTWSLGFSLAKAVTVNFSKNVSAADCRAEAEANTKYFQSSCQLSGNEHLHVVKQQCSDVP